METATQGCDGLGLSNSKFMTEIPGLPESQVWKRRFQELLSVLSFLAGIHPVWYQLIQFTQFLKHTQIIYRFVNRCYELASADGLFFFAVYKKAFLPDC